MRAEHDPGELTEQVRSRPHVRLRLTVTLVAVSLVIAAVATSTVLSRPQNAGSVTDAHTVQIRRTAYGIPHILAHDFRGLGYGYGHAFAEDNLCSLADQVLTVRGERSRYLGPTATSTDSLSRGTTNLASDTYYQGIRSAGTVARLVARPAPLGPTAHLRQLVAGYVAGYNRYLRDTGVAHLPDPTCRGKGWARPITTGDIWSILNAVNRVAGTEALKKDIATAAPPTDTTGGAAGPTGSTATPAGATARSGTTGRSAMPSVATTLADDTGSNGWALGRDATRAHDGMVLATPHLPWTGNARFYQVQLTIPGVIDVSGASLAGTPVVEIGHTRGVAWTHTASHAQHGTIYRLTLAPGDPTSYLVDGKAVPMSHRTVRITARDAHGTLSTESRTLYTSRYGPLLATGWTDSTAYAARDANADNLRSMNEWLAMDRSQNLAQLRTAQAAYQGNPWMYTLATDANGVTSYADTSVVPHVTDPQRARCLVQADPGDPDILDGSTTACDWGTAADAVEPGIFGPGDEPALRRNDYVANSNNSPRYTNPAAPLTDFPGTFDSRTNLEPRPRLGLQMIADRRSGADGLGAPGFTLRTLQSVMFGNRVLSAEWGRADALAMCHAHPVLPASDGTSVDVRAACRVLARWDSRTDRDSHGAVLWEAFFGHLAGSPDPWWTVPFDPAHPVSTPRGIDGDAPVVRHALADAVRELADQDVPLDATPGDTMRWHGVPLHGGDEAPGCFNVVQASTTSGHDGTDPAPENAAKGTSFVMAVEMTAHGPRTRTVLTYSESANPASPHFSDQTVLFSQKRWVTERFTDAEISADPHLHTTTLHL
ncbi:MAG: penicillin acylase family protein [Actinocatenispora sp.]